MLHDRGRTAWSVTTIGTQKGYQCRPPISPDVVVAVQPQEVSIVPITRPNRIIGWVDSFDVRIQFGGQGRFYDVEAVEAQPATRGAEVSIGLDLLLRIRMGWPRKAPDPRHQLSTARS